MIDLQDVKVKNSSDWDSICPFPVGFVYISRETTSPSETYGGQWTSMPNRFMNIVPTSNPISQGGSTNHMHLTTLGTASGEDTLYIVDGNKNYPGEWTTSSGAVYNGIFAEGTKVLTQGGSGSYFGKSSLPSHHSLDSHSAYRLNSTSQSNNIPPYTTVYAWYRTA